MVKTLHFQCRGHRFNHQGDKIPYATRRGQKKEREKIVGPFRELIFNLPIFLGSDLIGQDREGGLEWDGLSG